MHDRASARRASEACVIPSATRGSGSLPRPSLSSHIRAMAQDFSGRVAIVTGASRGLGRAAAQRLYERGASVAINVRDQARADAAAKALGERALGVAGDIAGRA